MDTRTPKEDRKALVVRHNALIESRHRLTLLERRFMLWIVSQISKEDLSMHTYRISVRRFVEFAGLKEHEHYYGKISKLADSLTQRNIVIKNKELKIDSYYSWFDAITYDWGKGEITASISEGIRPFLLQLKEKYTAITLEYALLLKSSYAHRLYDLLKQYEGIGERTMEIERMKVFFDISGKYEKYKDFRVRVLEQAKDEITQRTDLTFDFFPIKEGRKVVAVRFVIRQNRPPVTLDNPEETDPDAKTLFRCLMKHGVKEGVARNLIGQYDSERVAWHIKEYEKRLKSDQPPAGAGWLVEGIKKDYRPQQSIFQKEEQAEREQKAQKRREWEQLQEEVDALKKACDKQNRTACLKIFNAMSEEEQAEIYADTTKKCWSFPNISQRIKEEGMKNPMVSSLVLHEISEQHPETKTSYHDYAKAKKAKKKVLDLLKNEEKSSY